MCSAKLLCMVWLFLQVKTDVTKARENTSVILHEWLRGCTNAYFRCSQDTQHYCHCDEFCNQYMDCCSDARYAEKPVQTFESNEYISRSSCNLVASMANRGLGVFMVSRCKDKWPKDVVRENCENEKHTTLLNMVPVFDKTTFLTFRNEYCAICNGLSIWFGWDLRLECRRHVFSDQHVTFTDMVFQAINSTLCDYRFLSPYPEFSRNCSLYINSAWTPEEENICATGILQPIIIITETNEIFARNTKCAERKLLYINERILHIQCMIMYSRGQGLSFSLSTILDYSSLITNLEDPGPIQCGEMDISLPDMDECQELFCPTGFHPHYGECISNGVDTGVVLDILLEINTHIGQSFIYQLLRALDNKILKELRTPYAVYQRIMPMNSDMYVFIGVDTVIDSSCSFLHLVVPLYIKGTYDRKSITQDLIQAIQNCSFLFENQIRADCIESVENRTCKSNSTIANPKYVLPILTTYYERDLPCAAVQVDLLSVNHTANHTTNDGNDWFSFKSTSTRIDASHILRVGNEFYVCISTYQDFYLPSHEQLATFATCARFWSNMGCSCLSILSTLCLLCHYYKNVLGTRVSVPFVILLIFLLVEQSQFLLISLWTSIDKTICLWLASVHHFTWTSTFSFMFVSLLRLHADITTLEQISDMTFVRNIKYIAFGFTIPALITFGTKLSELLITSTGLWYGGKFCFINNHSVLLYTFIVPIILYIFANIIVFGLIIHYIRTTTKRVRHTNNVCIYLRIASTLGATWIIGVINGMVRSESLAWIFEITTNLQGFAIMLGFMCNKRTLLAYKEKLFTPKEQPTIPSIGRKLD